jgi:hypothetical protein
VRAPLGPFPTPIDYPTVLPFTLPAGRDLHFYRGNFCGVRIPGTLPAPGSNDQNPELVMACLLDNYPADVQDRYLATYASYGYTHLQRSLGHAIWYGHTLEEYIALSRRAQQHGLFCDHWFLGGGEGDGSSNPFKARDKDATYWGPFLQPYLDALLGAGVVDAACVGWQLDQFNAPGNPLISIIAWLGGALPGEVPLFTHWVNHAMAWWADKGQQWTDDYQSIWVCDRFTWWAAMQPYLTGGHHQGSNEEAITDPKLYQDKLLDTLEPFGGETGKGDMGQSRRGGVKRNFEMTAWEVTAQYQFDNRCTEDVGDLTGYLTMCTTSSRGNAMAGYGNGARMPDGSAL